LAPPPRGATGDGGFRTTPEMMSILGCSAAELGNVLKVLGFRLDRRRVAPDPLAEPTAAVAPEATAAAAAEGETASAPAQAEEGTNAAPTEAPAAIAPPPDGVAAVATLASADAAEEIWEEIWRPRRRGREPEQRPEPPQGSPRRPAEPAPVRPAEVRQDRPDQQRKRRRDKRHKERHEERPRLHLEASPPGAKTGGFDPNSPFAALYSLKAAMDKRTQD